jgi:UDP-N-acetylmuramoylalanine--D-glutamate ligase
MQPRTITPAEIAMGTRAVVMGLGQFGGGLGATRHLAALGYQVLVTDTASADKLAAPLRDLAPLLARDPAGWHAATSADRGRVFLRLGEHRTEDFATADVVVANPAVPKPWSNPYLQAARQGKARLVTEMGLLLAMLPPAWQARCIAVTGTAGKSTTTSMIAYALESLGERVLLGGNIGRSLLDELRTRREQGTLEVDVPWLVLEMSSFMLWWLSAGAVEMGADTVPFAPRVVLCTNLSANHLDWHVTLEHYRTSKQELFVRLSSTGQGIVGPGLREWAGLSKAPIIHIESGITQPMALPGSHNRINAAMAIEAVCAALPTAHRSEVTAAVTQFTGLSHRLHLCCEKPLASAPHHRIRFIDDSKSTTPEATMMALSALGEDGPLTSVHLILGGYDKGSDFTALAAQLASSNLAGIWCIGAMGSKLTALISQAGALRVTHLSTIDEAMQRIEQALRARPASATILLSPGCASWDQFINYEQRGKRFVELAMSCDA